MSRSEMRGIINRLDEMSLPERDHTLDEWLATEYRRLETFKAMWIANNAKNPTEWPSVLAPGEWDEQFRAYTSMGNGGL